MNEQNKVTERILRLPEVIERTGLSRSSIYDFMNKGDFPKSISLGARSVGWKQSNIDDWIDDRTYGDKL